MQKILFIFFIISFLSISCRCSKNQAIAMVKQGIEGYVYLQSGNRMPSPENIPHKNIGISTVIYIYELTNIDNVIKVGASPFYTQINKKLITRIQTDSTGFFSVQLPVGKYSLFLKINDQFYANSFDLNNNIQPVIVEENNVTHCIIYQNANAVY